MIVNLEDLTALLDRVRPKRGDTTAREALAVKFVDVHRPTTRGATFHTASGGLLVVDLDAEGKVVGLEIV